MTDFKIIVCGDEGKQEKATMYLHLYKTAVQANYNMVTTVLSHLFTVCHKEMEGLGKNDTAGKLQADVLLEKAYRVYPVDRVYSKTRTQEIRSMYADFIKNNIEWDGEKTCTVKNFPHFTNLYYLKIRISLSDAAIAYTVIASET
jgi:hypothetical protein